MEANFRVQATEKNADDNSRATFLNMPIGYYQIQVEGNDEFQPSHKAINIVNEEEKDEVVVYVGIKPRIDVSTEFTFVTLINDQE